MPRLVSILCAGLVGALSYAETAAQRSSSAEDCGLGPVSVSGMVRSHAFRPIAGAWVGVSPINESGCWVRTDSAGVFRLEGLAANRAIEAHADGFQPAGWSLRDIDAGREALFILPSWPGSCHWFFDDPPWLMRSHDGVAFGEADSLLVALSRRYPNAEIVSPNVFGHTMYPPTCSEMFSAALADLNGDRLKDVAVWLADSVADRLVIALRAGETYQLWEAMQLIGDDRISTQQPHMVTERYLHVVPRRYLGLLSDEQDSISAIAGERGRIPMDGQGLMIYRHKFPDILFHAAGRFWISNNW